MEKEEIKTATAETTFTIDVECPYCNSNLDKTDKLIDHLDYNELRSNSCEAELTCQVCNKEFIVTKITY